MRSWGGALRNGISALIDTADPSDPSPLLHVRTQHDDVYEPEVYLRHQSAGPLILGPPHATSRTEKFLFFEPPVYGISLWQRTV